MWRLSKLNIRGFKSFAESAELVFPEGITAVVGPNGCGKSNISDAIVWALGEQSTNVLRAHRMDDVIFQGTESRRSSGIAEVTLHLSRRDVPLAAESGNGTGSPLFPVEEIEAGQDAELSITRRLYRSGDSEYLLNGDKCLLREVKERLLGTGLGSRACFTIGQGRIDQILSDSPVERRAPIEEAAGISLYRRRRHRTNLKLEATAQDLARVQDICDEVARQMRSLKRQAGKAKRYRELRERLRAAEREWFSIRVVEAESAADTSRAALQAAGLGEDVARQGLEAATRAWENARRAWRDQRQERAARRQKLYSVQLEHERAKAEVQRQADRVQLATQRLEELRQRVSALEARRDDEAAVLEARREAAARADEAARAAERIVQDARELLDPIAQLEIDADVQADEQYEMELLSLAARIEIPHEHRAAVSLLLGRRLRVPLLPDDQIDTWLEAVAERRGLTHGLRRPGATPAPGEAPSDLVICAMAELVDGDDLVATAIAVDLMRDAWLVADREAALQLAVQHPELGFVDSAGTVWARGSEIVLRNETSPGDLVEESARASTRLRLKSKGSAEAETPAVPTVEQEAARLSLERAEAGLRAARAQSAATAREAQAVQAGLRQQQRELDRCQSEIAQLDRTVTGAGEQGDAASERVDATAARCAELDKELEGQETVDVAEDAEMGGLEAVVAAGRRAVEQAQVRRSSAEVEAAELRVARRHLHEQIRERLDMEPWQLLQQAQQDATDLDSGAGDTQPEAEGERIHPLTLQRQISDLRAAIDRLGPVNLVAYDDFQTQETRFHDLDGQRRDLVGAAANLRDAIRKIDADCVTRFTEAFDAIDGYFNRIMRQLFGGGRAGMRLDDPDDPLNSGIEIVAQPPGKALQSIRLLSGGERSMIALALMFAIFEYHPSPFCILDEADAALDDRNVLRFVQALNSFQERAQFIMITHNKRSMEAADLLYGVTMEESGVSKLVSVALT